MGFQVAFLYYCFDTCVILERIITIPFQGPVISMWGPKVEHDTQTVQFWFAHYLSKFASYLCVIQH